MPATELTTEHASNERLPLAEHRSRVMGSDLHVLITTDPGSSVDPTALLALATGELGRLEHAWTRFDRRSDLSRINLAEGRTVRVGPDTLVLVATMILAWRVTGGRYNPNLLPALVEHGGGVSRVDPTRTTVLPSDPRHDATPVGCRVDLASSSVTAPSGLTFDPGGIGKGLAGDLVVERLLDQGALGALVSIGGDVSMGGAAPDPDGWVVAVEHADPADGVLCRLAIDRGGVATSSTRSRRWTCNGRDVHHVLDPSTGTMSSTDLAAVTVIAPTGWEAEVHATAALLDGSCGAIAYLAGHRLSGIAITTGGDVLRTADLDGIELLPSSRGVRP